MSRAPGDHRTLLREELVAAAARRARPAQPAPARHKRRWPPALVAAAITVVVVLGTAVIAGTPRPASADTFRVAIRDGEVVVTVEGLVEDPDDAEAELRAAGLDATLSAQPAAPSLNGVVVATTSTFGPLDSESDGTRILAFRIPADERRPFTIEYGRAARPGETYVATEPVPACDHYAGKPLGDAVVAEIARRWGPDVSWQRQSGGAVTGVQAQDVGERDVVVTVVPLSPRSVLVRVTDDLSALSEEPC